MLFEQVSFRKREQGMQKDAVHEDQKDHKPVKLQIITVQSGCDHAPGVSEGQPSADLLQQRLRCFMQEAPEGIDTDCTEQYRFLRPGMDQGSRCQKQEYP